MFDVHADKGNLNYTLVRVKAESKCWIIVNLGNIEVLEN